MFQAKRKKEKKTYELDRGAGILLQQSNEMNDFYKPEWKTNLTTYPTRPIMALALNIQALPSTLALVSPAHASTKSPEMKSSEKICNLSANPLAKH